ncbi:MAG: hypothetical protein H6917_19435 [Novosphingobium sp.]|nr:hypothetical protein [Novosphingobium sp.]
MNLTRDRLQSIGWAFVLTVCFALTMALTFRVNAVKSQVRLAERQIVALKQEKLFLETEFEARSNQQQLTALNDIEFGYQAPKAEQYIEGERQLSNLGKPRAPDAPAPIRVASAAGNDRNAPFPAMVSPLTGKPAGAEPRAGKTLAAAGPDELGDLLTRIELGEAGHE